MFSRLLICSALIGALLSGGVAVAGDTVNAARYFKGSLMPKAEQRRLAHRILGDAWLKDAELDDYFSRIAVRLSADDEFLIAVADTPDVNAFAYYSGILVFYRGLWRFAESESELIGILAHEMAHITQNHFEATRDNTELASAITAPILIAGILVDDPEVSQALISGSAGLLKNSVLSYSRELEHEADVVALNTLLDAEFDPTGMIQIFSRFKDSAYEYLSSHPSSQRREAYLSNRLLTTEHKSQPSSLDFKLLKQKLALKKDLLRSFAKKQALIVKKAVTDEDRVVAQYGLLLVATQTRNFPVGEQMVEALRDETHPYIVRAMAENLLARGRTDEAQAMLDEALAAHPGQAALALMRLIVYERADDYAAGLVFYQSLPAAVRGREDILAQSGRLAALAKQPFQSNYLLAQSHQRRGFFERALAQIEIAEQYKSDNTDLLADLHSLKTDLKAELELIKEKKFEN